MKNAESGQAIEMEAAAGPPKTKRKYRFVVLSALWLTGVFLYFDRVNISMAAPYIKDELGLSGLEIGFILSIYYWGYIAGQLIGGVAADRFNIRVWVTVLYLGWCVTTVLTGLSRTVLQMSVIRTVFGFAEGAVINPVTKLQNHWAFPDERGFTNGIQMACAYLGLVVGMPAIGLLITLFGWRVMFFVTGAMTLIGVAVFWVLVYDHPQHHPRISEEEKNSLVKALAMDRVTYDPDAKTTKKLEFKEAIRLLFGNWAYWLICVSFFFISGVYFTNFSWLPGYLMMERGFSGLDSGLALMLPYMAAAAGALLGGIFGDRLGNRCLIILVAVALSVPAIGGMLMVQERAALIAMLCAMLFLNAAAVTLCVVLLFDIFPPEIIGVALAMMSGAFGASGGIVGPLAMGLAYDLTGSFAMGFIGMAAGLLFSAMLLVAVYFYERRVKIEKRARSAITGRLPHS